MGGEQATGRAAAGSRRRLALLTVPIAVLSAAGVAAAALTPLLVREAPLLLLALESRNRYLLLVAARVDLVPFLAVGVVRRLASDPFFYLLGRWYGDRGVAWVERRAGGGSAARALERAFARVSAPAVLLFPGALVCVLAGSSGMSPRRFVALNLAGSVGAVVGLRLFADALAGPLGTVVAFSDRNAGWLTAVFVAVTAALLLLDRRRAAGDPSDPLADRPQDREPEAAGDREPEAAGDRGPDPAGDPGPPAPPGSASSPQG